METYVILRRGGWQTPSDLIEAVTRSAKAAELMPDEVSWTRSYALEERDGTVGTVCIYQASNPEAIRRHSDAADLPIDEIVKVVDTVIVTPDPIPVAST
jgi:hypothetical protein